MMLILKAPSDQENNTVMQRIKIRMLTKVSCPYKQFLLIAFPFKDPMNPIFHSTIDIKKGFSPFKNNEISETCSKDEKEKLDTNCSKLCVLGKDSCNSDV